MGSKRLGEFGFNLSNKCLFIILSIDNSWVDHTVALVSGKDANACETEFLSVTQGGVASSLYTAVFDENDMLVGLCQYIK